MLDGSSNIWPVRSGSSGALTSLLRLRASSKASASGYAHRGLRKLCGFGRRQSAGTFPFSLILEAPGYEGSAPDLGTSGIAKTDCLARVRSGGYLDAQSADMALSYPDSRQPRVKDLWYIPLADVWLCLRKSLGSVRKTKVSWLSGTVECLGDEVREVRGGRGSRRLGETRGGSGIDLSFGKS